MRKINLDLKNQSYDVRIGSGIINLSNVEKFVSNKEVLIVFDSAINGSRIKQFKEMISKFTLKLELIKIDATEKNKSQKTLSKIHSVLCRK